MGLRMFLDPGGGEQGEGGVAMATGREGGGGEDRALCGFDKGRTGNRKESEPDLELVDVGPDLRY